MPELPEVETTRRGIAPHIQQKIVTSVTVRNPNLRWPVPVSVFQLLAGSELIDVQRRGKYLLLKFAQGYAMLHLGMSGSLRIVKQGEPPNTHDHVDIAFVDGTVLRYHDPRRFGSLHWVEGDPLSHQLLAKLGPEPLSDAFNVDYIFAASRKRKQAVKPFIMDSHVVVGVGNIYATEALFSAGIRPTKPAGSVSRKAFELLVSDIKQVLANAITQGGTTLRDFVGGDGKPGYFKQQLKAYGRGGEPCVVCQKPLKEVRLGQRSTVYCTACQR